MTEKQLKDEELKQVAGGADERDELRVNSSATGNGIININIYDDCHFNPSKYVKREGIGMCLAGCGSCKYNEHPSWMESTCNVDVEQQ